MAENPFLTLSRILGGVVLMQGGLGHQVLGQLLLTGSHEVTIAGASLVIAATSREKNAVGQAVIRTLAPAAAIYALTYREDKRLHALQREIERKRRELTEAQRGLEMQGSVVRSLQAKVARQKADADTHEGRVTANQFALAARQADLEDGQQKLERDLQAHRDLQREYADRVAAFDQERKARDEELAACRARLDAADGTLRERDTALQHVEEQNRRLVTELTELSARLQQESKVRRKAKPAAAAKRPRPPNKK